MRHEQQFELYILEHARRARTRDNATSTNSPISLVSQSVSSSWRTSARATSLAHYVTHLRCTRQAARARRSLRTSLPFPGTLRWARGRRAASSSCRSRSGWAARSRTCTWRCSRAAWSWPIAAQHRWCSHSPNRRRLRFPAHVQAHRSVTLKCFLPGAVAH